MSFCGFTTFEALEWRASETECKAVLNDALFTVVTLTGVLLELECRNDMTKMIR